MDLKTGFDPTFVLTNQPLGMAFGLIPAAEHGLRTQETFPGWSPLGDPGREGGLNEKRCVKHSAQPGRGLWL